MEAADNTPEAEEPPRSEPEPLTSEQRIDAFFPEPPPLPSVDRRRRRS